MPRSVEDVYSERVRQIFDEGFDHNHDKLHTKGELAVAGMCYAGHASLMIQGEAQDSVPGPWPFDASWWKPSHDVRRNLVKAAALIVAEIDRLDYSADDCTAARS